MFAHVRFTFNGILRIFWNKEHVFNSCCAFVYISYIGIYCWIEKLKYINADYSKNQIMCNFYLKNGVLLFTKRRPIKECLLVSCVYTK